VILIKIIIFPEIYIYKLQKVKIYFEINNLAKFNLWSSFFGVLQEYYIIDKSKM